MQTFRASSGDSESNDGKAEYKPYIPGETKPGDAEAREMQEQVMAEHPIPPAPAQTPVDTVLPSGDITTSGAHTQAHTQAPIQQQYPIDTQYLYQPPSAVEFREDHGGMDRQTFRRMIIGLMVLTLLIFIVIIMVFGRRGNHGHYKQTQEVNDIIIFEPAYNQSIGAPTTILGQARGYWFFEGAFPVTIYDNNLVPVASTTATAQADWDTSEFVPFQAVVPGYDQAPSKKKGFIIFQQGTLDLIAQNEKVFKLPIRFQKGATVVSPGVNQDIDPLGSSVAKCADGVDNDQDNLIDIQDPDCHTDLNPGSFESYNKQRAELGLNTIPVNDGQGGDSSSDLDDGDTPINDGSDTGSLGAAHNGRVTLYFANRGNNPWNPDCSQLYTTQRDVGKGTLEEVIARTVRATIDGPGSTDSALGLVSAVRQGLTISDIRMSGTTLSVYLAGGNTIAGGPDWCNAADARKQIARTMEQFAGVTDVKIYANGRLQ